MLDRLLWELPAWLRPLIRARPVFLVELLSTPEPLWSPVTYQIAGHGEGLCRMSAGCVRHVGARPGWVGVTLEDRSGVFLATFSMPGDR